MSGKATEAQDERQVEKRGKRNVKNYDPSYGRFPPCIENPRMQITKTEIPSGSGIAYANGFLYLISAEGGGSLRIFGCEGDAISPLGSLTGLGNMRQIRISNIPPL